MNHVIATPEQAIRLGRLGENEVTTVKFPDSVKLKEEYPEAQLTLINKRNGDLTGYPVDPQYLSYEGGMLCWLVQSGDLTAYGTGNCELVAYEGDKVDKSVIYTTFVDKALDGSGNPPEPWEGWIQRLIEEAYKAEAAARNYPRISEENTWEVWDVDNEEWVDTGISAVGPEGFSPSVTVSEIVGGHRITITDLNGPHSFNVFDGDDGVSPVITITDITGGHRVVITDLEGPHEFDVMDGDDGLSPAVTITNITGGHKLTITDATGPHEFNVMDGAEGLSPSVSVSSVTGGHKVTITDSSGPHEFTILDGAEGYSPVVVVSSITGGHKVTITDSSGPHEFNVMDGDDGDTPNFSIGTVTTGEPGTPAVVTITGTPSNPVLNFTIPKGDTGATPTVPVTDVQINGTSLLVDGVANFKQGSNTEIKGGSISARFISPEKQHVSAFYALAKLAGVDLASSDTPVGTYTAEAKAAILAMLGAVSDTDAADENHMGLLRVASIGDIKAGNSKRAVTALRQYRAVFYGLAEAAGASMSASNNGVGVYTPEAKSAIQTMLGIEADIPLIEEVSGSTPSITGMPNVRYICGTVSLLSITPPASGSMVVRFTSGSSPTILTVPNTVKFPVWFDYTALEANTTYEIIITDGVYGGVMSWAA